jgi:hypothetical protein
VDCRRVRTEGTYDFVEVGEEGGLMSVGRRASGFERTGSGGSVTTEALEEARLRRLSVREGILQ